MALIEYDVYKQKLRDLQPELEKLSAALDIESAKQEAARLEAETAMDGFWNNLERSTSVSKKVRVIENKLAHFNKLIARADDVDATMELAAEMEDDDLVAEAGEEIAKLEDDFDEAVFSAAKYAADGDIVLLSPACAAFDKFQNFAERGRHFKKLVMELE